MYHLAPLYTLVYQKQDINYFGQNRRGFGSNFCLERLSDAMNKEMEPGLSGVGEGKLVLLIEN